MLKRYSVWLDPLMVEALKNLARRLAAQRRIDMSWVDLLRAGMKQLLAQEAKETVDER